MSRYLNSAFALGAILALGACKEEPAKNQPMSQEMVKAIYKGEVNKVKELLDAGEPVDAVQNGQTALCLAAMHGVPDVLQLLLARGAQVNYQDADGLTPLMYAASSGQLEAVKILISQKAELEAKTKLGETALHGAVAHGKRNVVEFLLDRGADLRSTTNTGRNALVVALDRVSQANSTAEDTALVKFIKSRYGAGADTLKSSVAPQEAGDPAAKPIKK